MKLIYFSCFMMSFIMMTSCMTSSTSDLVLKKSADPTPDWIYANGEVSSTNPQYVNVVFSRSDLYNLPLGLKQSQTIAYKKIASLVLSDVEKKIIQKIEKTYLSKKINNLGPFKTNISRIVNRASLNLKIETPLAEQLYWEYRQQERNHDSRTYYIVWVLLLVPKTVYDSAFLTIAQELQKSTDEVTATLGNEILQQPTKR